LNRRPLLLWPLALLGAAGGIGAWRQGRSGAASILPASLRLGYAVAPPFAWVDGGGRVTGESPELARLVMARLGINQADWLQMEPWQLVPALQSGRIDVAAAGLAIHPQHAHQARFSAPTLRVAPGLLMRQGLMAALPPGPITLAGMVRGSGLRVAVLTGSAQAQAWAALGAGPSRTLAVPDVATGRAALLAQAADALLLALPTARLMAAGSGGRLQAWSAQEPLHPEADMAYTAHAFGPDAAGLQAAWDNALAALVGRPAHQGVLLAQGLGPDDLPGDISTQALLRP
jgi:polar amino acid transport system substrate-binding protein